MARIPPLNYQGIDPSLAMAFDEHTSRYNTRITNMKATLAHSPLAFEVYMQWYPLYEKVKSIIGERPACLFAYSISFASDCPLCSTYFRKKIIEAGETPEQLSLTDYEASLLRFGSAIAANNGHIDDQVYNAVAEHHDAWQLVVLIAFAGQMIATNVFSNATETDIDEYLFPFLPQNA